MRALIQFNSLLLLGLLQLAPTVSAWGDLGHRTVGYLAKMYLNDTALDYVEAILDGEDISNAAVWPDEYKQTHQWSAPWHYLDANDTAPKACGVINFPGCPAQGCIVSAMVNQSKIVNDPTWSPEDRRNALAYIIHFVGDMHQPLHSEHEARGGNLIKVKFDSHSTNLHAVWDDFIPDKWVLKTKNENTTVAAGRWATKLFKNAPPATGAMAECPGLPDTQKCVLSWSGDANKVVCRYALRDGLSGVSGQELGGAYYAGAVPFVEKMITLAGQRLAGYITLLAEQYEALSNEKSPGNRLVVQH